ncbi:C1-like protein [Corchorus olitorius]|uniref:C1-like protein n=1 Tax=Corchorus olitorius TaxID=93759 RepID=A0A1R3JNS2_9ROSI|nr:C1-like protein [Corchorus olitorius]
MAFRYLVRHEHPLMFIGEFKPKPGDILGNEELPQTMVYLDDECCRECREPILGGPGFMCEICRVGFHKECAEQPLKIHDHPSHRIHTLFLQSHLDPGQTTSNAWVCKLCSRTLVSPTIVANVM